MPKYDNLTLEEKQGLTSWFNFPQETKEAAISLYEYDLFKPAAIFKTPEGKYCLGLLKPQRWGEKYVEEAAGAMRELLGYEMVAHTGPVIEGWKDVKFLPTNAVGWCYICGEAANNYGSGIKPICMLCRL